MPSFRLIHLSDLHISVQPDRFNRVQYYRSESVFPVKRDPSVRWSLYPSSYSDTIAEGAARFLWKTNKKFDVLAITGDLATTGRKVDLECAADYVLSPAQKKYNYLNSKKLPTLNTVEERIFLLPGNHDRFSDVIGTPGGRQFDHTFSRLWKQLLPRVTRCVIKKSGEIVVILGADFSLRKSSHSRVPYLVNRFGQGRVYQDTLKRLIRATKKYRSLRTRVIVIWAVHFCPTDNCAPEEELINSSHLIGAADACSVDMMISGHVHKLMNHKTPKGAPILSAGSVCAIERWGNNWLHVLDFQASSGRLQNFSVKDYGWDDDRDDFTYRDMRSP